jgi:DNA-binding winged helix-turn-helix (wHTH) protein/Flp pilus assembly protein TadD
MTNSINAEKQATENNKATRYLIDDLTLDVQRGELTRYGEALTLPKLSYDLLVALAQSAPALLSQAELMQIVWPERVIGDETLKQRVKLLRKSLGDNASNPQYIEAVRGRGYRLIPQVICECVVKRSPSVMLDLSANDLFPNLLPVSLNRWWRRLSNVGLIIFVVIVLTALFTSSFYQQTIQPEKITNNEKKNHRLEEIVGKSAFKLYQRGREYYKRYRAQDNEIAIDFFLKAIKEKTTFSQAYAGLSQAYSQQYFQFGGNEKSKQAAIDNAYLAISYNNSSADAYKALGTAYYVSGWLSKSVNALLRAQTIADDDREILTNLAFIYSEQGKFEQALYWHKKALQASPDYAVAMLHLAITLQRNKYDDLALKWFKKAYAQQPDYLLTTYHLSQLYIELQQFEKAREVIDRSMKVQNNHPILLEALADSYFFQGELEVANVTYQKVNEQRLNQPINQANIYSILLTKDDKKTQEKAKEQEQLIEKYKQQLVALHLSGNEKPSTSLYLAEVSALLNDSSAALRYLVQAIEQGQVFNYQIEKSLIFNDLRKIRRFKILRRQHKHVKNKDLIIDEYILSG